MGDSGCFDPLPWETRNLGVSAFGVSAAFFSSPDIDVLQEGLAGLRQAHRDFFVQARFKAETRTARILEACGFYFVEATVCPHVDLSKYTALERFADDPWRALPARYRASAASVEPVGRSDHTMLSRIKAIAGESFLDDRFHVDDNCAADIASRRYVLWVEDLFRDESVRFHALLVAGESIGFMASRAGRLLLAGFDRRHAGAGLGEFLWLSVLQSMKADGVKSVKTLISVSNLPVLNLYTRLGFRFRDPQSTFHFWARSPM